MAQSGGMYQANFARYGRFLRTLALFLGVLIFLVWGVWGTLPHTALRSLFSPITAVDINQHRRDTPAPIPTGAFTLQQTFTPRWNGFRELEVRFYRVAETPNAGKHYLALARRRWANHQRSHAAQRHNSPGPASRDAISAPGKLCRAGVHAGC